MAVDDPQTASAPETGGWKFDDAVTAAFDDMLQKSIPQYDVMRRAVTDAACWFLDRYRDQTGTFGRVVDLGTSRGSALAPIIERMRKEARYQGFEISEPMLRVARERFAESREVTISQWDLRDGYPQHEPAAAIISTLTLQFVPIEYRQRLLRGVWKHLVPGGAFIWTEKVLGATADLDALQVDLYYGLKRENGYSQEAIDRKRLSLEGVLVPLTAKFNEELLSSAGFQQVDCVWSWMNFRTWVAIKGG